MLQPEFYRVQCLSPTGLHHMAYWQWGDPLNDKVLICVHGLTRQGRDFDVLAQTLCQHYRVICPDVVGRGQSDWLIQAGAYRLSTYVADMVTLLARLNATTVHWLGTSMGGLIGMILTGLPQSPIQRLVLNDVGPEINATALHRIASYLGRNMHWANEEQAFEHLAFISKTFGPHTAAQWHALNSPMLKPDKQGVKLHYDPAIAQPFAQFSDEAAAAGAQAIWLSYDNIRCPTLLLRGAESDLLSQKVAQAMTQRGPRAQRHDFAGVGHAPTLVHTDQIEVVSTFLLAP